MLQRSYKLVVLGTLGMRGYAHLKWYYKFVENICVYLQSENQFSHPMLFWTYCKNIQTYFGYFRHTCLFTTKKIVSTCRILWCLSVCRKKFIIPFFTEIFHLKEPCKYLGWQHVVITGDPEFCQIWEWCWNISNNNSFHFRLLPRKTNNKIQRNIFWSHWVILLFFAQIWAKLNFSGKKPLSVFKYSNHLPSCQKPGKSNMLFLRKMLLDEWKGMKDRQPWLFFRPSVERGSNHYSNFKISWIYIKTPKISLLQ